MREKDPDLEEAAFLDENTYLGSGLSYIPLAHPVYNDPPLGEVRLFEPVESAWKDVGIDLDDPEQLTLHKELEQRRARLQEGLAVGDLMVLRQRALEFAGFASTLLRQRFGINVFLHQLNSLPVVERAEELWNRYGDIVLDTDLTETRLRSRSERQHTSPGLVSASPGPVVEALTARGLWVPSDQELETLAKSLISMARQQFQTKPGEPEGET